MTIYYRSQMTQLPCQVGIDQADGSRSSEGNEGYMSFGPNLQMAAGRYFGGFHIKILAPSTHPSAVTIDAACQHGNYIITNRLVPGDTILSGIAGLVGLDFELGEPEDRVEVRLHVASGVMVNVQALVIFRVKTSIA